MVKSESSKISFIDNRGKILIKYIFKNALKYSIILIMLYGLNNVCLYDTMFRPFGIGFAIALILLGIPGYYLGGLYAISYLSFQPNIFGIIHIIGVIIVMLILELFRTKINKRLSSFSLCMALFITNISGIVVCISDWSKFLPLIVCVAMGEIFLICSIVSVNAMIGKFRLSKIRIDEKICCAIILILFIVGLSRIHLGIISCGLIGVSAIIMFSSFALPSGYHLIMGLLLGIGYSISTQNPVYISMFMLLTMMSVVFKCRIKILSAMSILITYIIFNLYFNTGLAIGEMISIVIGCTILLCVPIKKLEAIANIFNNNVHVYRDVEIDIKSRIETHLIGLEKVFYDMSQNYKDMIRGSLDDKEAITLIKDELISNVCSNCSNKYNCVYAANSFTYNAIEMLVNNSYKKKKALLIDVPDALSVHCNYLNALLSNLNNILITYNNYSKSVNDLDMSRLMISKYLSTVGSMLTALRNNINETTVIDKCRENELIEILGYNGIQCVDVSFYYSLDNVPNIILLVNNNDTNDRKLIKIVNNFFKIGFKVLSITKSDVDGYSRVSMVSVSNYQIAFGVSSVNQDGSRQSGDSYSIIELSDGKYMISICDGMGSGERAKRVSGLAIRLIENFYRAGFDGDTILTSVNNLLILSDDERFSTIDLCIVDTRNNFYDFIKLGATTGFIKHKNGEVEIIESNHLPIGMIEDICPHGIRKLICPYDILIMCSDGVTDIISDKEIINYLHITDKVNPQEIADSIIHRVLQNSGGVASDDMTVVCFRLLENI